MIHLIVIGAGGHARVVAEAALTAGVDVIGFADDDEALHGGRVDGLDVVGAIESIPTGTSYVVGVGGPIDGGAVRARLVDRAQASGLVAEEVRHCSAIISSRAIISPGAVFLARSVVNSGGRVGPHAIVNTGAIVEHDAEVGAFAHIAPGAILCGGVRVGAGAHIGAGAVVRQGVTIGDRAVIGAGAVVVRHIPAETTVAGVPARELGVEVRSRD